MLLALSTSTPRCSVALWDGDGCVAYRTYSDARRHAERLLLEIDALCSEAGQSGAENLSAVACDVGPGSFAGTRIGLATAKGIALARRIPLYGIQGVRAMALAAFESNESVQKVACFVDAKRNEWFYALYDRGGSDAEILNVSKEFDVASLLHNETLWLCGDTLPELPRCLKTKGCSFPDAVWIARAAAAQKDTPSLADAATLEPSYVRAPDACIPARAPDFRLRKNRNKRG